MQSESDYGTEGCWTVISTWEIGVTGSHAGFKPRCRKACEFESRISHEAERCSEHTGTLATYSKPGYPERYGP